MYVFSFSSHYLLLIYFIISNSQNANNNAFPELRNSYSAISDSKTGYLFVRCLPSVHPTVPRLRALAAGCASVGVAELGIPEQSERSFWMTMNHTSGLDIRYIVKHNQT